MKKIAKLIIIIIAISGCNKDETPSKTPRLKNCRVEYLFFRDDITMSGDASMIIPPTDSSNTKCRYLYAGENMTKTLGGFYQGRSNKVFSNAVYDSIVPNGNKVYVYTKYITSDGIEGNAFNPLIFTLNSNGKLMKITSRDSFHPYGYDFNYTYSANKVTETNNNGKILRTFYFENNNLVKVVSEMYNFQGAIFSKKEILFQEFDNKPNPFKDMYFVKGAFFRAFSDNNYKSYTSDEYKKSTDGTLMLTSHYWVSMPFLYSTDGYPLFGIMSNKILLLTRSVPNVAYI